MLKLISLKVVKDLVNYLNTFKYDTTKILLKEIDDNSYKEHITTYDKNSFLSYYNVYYNETKNYLCAITQPNYISEITIINSTYNFDLTFNIKNLLNTPMITYKYDYHVKLDTSILKKIDSQVLWLTNLCTKYKNIYNVLTVINTLENIYSLCYAEQNWSEEYVYTSQIKTYMDSKNVFI